MNRFYCILFFLLLFFPAQAISQCLQGNCVDGFGTKILTPDLEFSGNFQNGIPEGYGEVTLPDGDTFQGNWSGGLSLAPGTLYFKWKKRFEQEEISRVVAGQASILMLDSKTGKGFMTLKDGRKYEGEIRNGVPDGNGVLVFPNGMRYDGAWQDGLPSGYGVATYADGNVFKGNFVAGRWQGQGTLLMKNGNTYQSTWTENEFRGPVTIVYRDGSRFVGSFAEGLEKGEGNLYLAGQKPSAEPVLITSADRGAVILPDHGKKMIVPPATEPPAMEVGQVQSMAGGNVAATAAGSAAGEYASVAADHVNIRSEPNPLSHIVMNVTMGYPLNLLGFENGWAKVIDYQGISGWVFGELLSKQPTVIIASSAAHLRAGPGLEHTIVAKSFRGSSFALLERQNGWVRLQSGSGDLWVRQDLVWPLPEE